MREFQIGDLVKYTTPLDDEELPFEGYVIGYAPHAFEPVPGKVHPVVANDGWVSLNAEPEHLTLLSEGHIEAAHRLRKRHLKTSGLLPLPDGPRAKPISAA